VEYWQPCARELHECGRCSQTGYTLANRHGAQDGPWDTRLESTIPW
jgi:hypothetical protein